MKPKRSLIKYIFETLKIIKYIRDFDIHILFGTKC